MYCSESPLCAQLVPIAKGAAQLTGLGFASGTISTTAPSYAAPCLAMKSQSVNEIIAVDRIEMACSERASQ